MSFREPGSGGSIPPRGAFRGGVTQAHRAIPQSLLARIYSDGPKTSGYLSLVRIQSAPRDGAVAQLVEHSRFAPCPSAFSRGACRDDSNHNRQSRRTYGTQRSGMGRIGLRNHQQAAQRFPSETQVKRGVRVVHGNKELREKLGRNDLCPCGSGRRF